MSGRDQSVLAGLSIVCVFNDPEVRRECLDRSIGVYGGDLDVDYVAVDNTARRFTSAGAALNHGARKARHDLVVFVHQDVYLHSIDRLAEAGRALGDGSWGLLGASGVTALGEWVGRLRDRTQLVGRSVLTPVEVDSVDEVLFMAPRELVLSQPLSEDSALAWHAYAVEYGLRLRQLGKRVGAIDLAITHNSLTVNLDKLDVAHRQVGARYPEMRPIRTTCGIISSRKFRWRDLPVLRKHRWRLRWLRHSVVAIKARRRMKVPIVLSDIRHEIDLLDYSDESPLYLVNIDHAGGFAEVASKPLRLRRYGRPVVMHVVKTLPDLLALLDELPSMTRILITGVGLDDLDEIRSRDDAERAWLVGIHPSALWLLGGPAARQLPSQWFERQAVPLAVRR
jgi:hypothetical protein